MLGIISDHPKRHCRRSRTGQGLVELAIVLPILLLLVAGAVDLGRLFYARVMVENAAKEGALFGATSPRCDTVKAGCVEPSTVEWHVEQEVAGLPDVTYSAACRDGATGTTKSVESCLEGDIYEVTVTYSFGLVTPILSGLVTNPLQLQSMSAAVVLNEAFDPNASPISFPTPAPTPTPSPGSCTVPDFDGVKKNSADGVWTGAGFSLSNLTFLPGNGNYSIHSQSVGAGTAGPCDTTTIAVGP